MRLEACVLALALITSSAFGGGNAVMTAGEEARALIGAEYLATHPSAKIVPHLSCTSEGGGSVVIDGVSDGDWWEGDANCQGRSVLLLKRIVGRQGEYPVWRIADAVVLPPHEINPGPERVNAWRLLGVDQCEIKGRPHTSFVALVRFGKRKLVDWRTGVKQAWTFDLKAGRIMPLSTRDIVCEWFEA